MANTVSIIELADHLTDPTYVIVDVRPMAAYNGWQLQGEARGGHIRGAVACPLSWTVTVEPAELETLFESKGLLPDKTVVVYSYSASDSAAMIKVLSDMGYPKVLVYEAGVTEWAADDRLPVERLANFEKLVYPEWLHKRINEEHSEEAAEKSFAIFHVDFDNVEEYKRGHITTAVYLDVSRLESESTGNRRSDEELETVLLSLGIRHNTTVVLYGRDTEISPGQTRPGLLSAARAAVILMYAGVKDVRLLDGGFDAWISAGCEVETTVCEPDPVEDFGVPIPGNPDYIVDIEEAKQLLADPSGALVSVRSWLEFTGESSGYDYIKPKGRIAGAVWANSGSDAHHVQNYRNHDNGMREYHEIEKIWRAAGITPDMRIGFYCGTGWRASEAFFDAYLLGWEQVAVYDGGWFEWSQDKSNPIERGGPLIGPEDRP